MLGGVDFPNVRLCELGQLSCRMSDQGHVLSLLGNSLSILTLREVGVRPLLGDGSSSSVPGIRSFEQAGRGQVRLVRVWPHDHGP